MRIGVLILIIILLIVVIGGVRQARRSNCSNWRLLRFFHTTPTPPPAPTPTPTPTPAPTPAPAPTPTPTPVQTTQDFNVGYRILEFQTTQNNQTKTLVAAVWYPSQDKTSNYNYYGQTPNSSLAVNGTVDKVRGPYPLIVFSHGDGGCGIQSVFFAEYMAQNGYIVVAPDHDDAAMGHIKGGPTSPIKLAIGLKKLKSSQDPLGDFASRPLDIKAVISEVFALNKNPQSFLYGAVNENQLAVSGHSFGTWTSEVIGGAVPSGYEYLTDLRVKVILLFAPGILDWIKADEYMKMNKPVMFLVGQDDMNDLSNGLPRRTAYDNSQPPKYMPIVKNAGHLAFSNAVCKGYQSIEQCQQNSKQAKTINKYSLAFVNRYLKGDIQAESILTTRDSGLSNLEYIK